ncbi:hypothetical protein A3Q56_01571 [Intoshia linei]|uniref:Uncharacterized protein n=1 Tax=Intoshia linei TaxID=1819745 RepID=A0A177B8R7_9BILA|nr:hypothetical protein A3Q56_01571 [Intoshia linei]
MQNRKLFSSSIDLRANIKRNVDTTIMFLGKIDNLTKKNIELSDLKTEKLVGPVNFKATICLLPSVVRLEFARKMNTKQVSHYTIERASIKSVIVRELVLYVVCSQSTNKKMICYIFQTKTSNALDGILSNLLDKKSNVKNYVKLSDQNYVSSNLIKACKSSGSVDEDEYINIKMDASIDSQNNQKARKSNDTKSMKDNIFTKKLNTFSGHRKCMSSLNYKEKPKEVEQSSDYQNVEPDQVFQISQNINIDKKPCLNCLMLDVKIGKVEKNNHNLSLENQKLKNKINEILTLKFLFDEKFEDLKSFL